MPKLVALYSPRAQSGKSVVAKEFYQASYEVVKFAAPLKDMVRGLLRSMGLSYANIERMVEGDMKEDVVPGFTTVTTRKLMQTLGTDWGREAVDTELWIKTALMKARALMRDGDNVVIDDLRFPNEFSALREAGACLVRIARPDAPSVGDCRYEGLLEGYDFDYYVDNLGTLNDLKLKALDLYDYVEDTWPVT